jgi:hypothetical protein
MANPIDSNANPRLDPTRPAENGLAVTKSDSTQFDYYTRMIWVGTAGDVAVVMKAGNTVIVPSVPAGTMLPIEVSKILSTGTTGSGFVIFW